MSKFGEFLDKKFQLTEKGTDVRTEVTAGIVTFMTMVYILMVNAGMFGDLGSGYFGAVYIATAISAVVGTLLIGLMAKLPLAQASGMGLNAFFVYTVCFGMNFTYANALLFVLIDGVVFILLTVTGLRKAIFNAIPDAVKVAIPAGIGLFIAFLGLQNAGIVVNDDSTLLKLVSMNFIGDATWAGFMPILVTLAALIATVAMSKKNVKGAILWALLGGAVLYYLLGLTVSGFYNPEAITYIKDEAGAITGYTSNYFLGYAATTDANGVITGYVANTLNWNPLSAFKDFGTMAVGKVFTEGFNFSAFLNSEGGSVASLVLLLITTSLAFCMVDMFDTLGTLYGACARGNLLDENGEVPNINKAMMADAVATCVGAICGTSTVTTFVESSAGIGEGGRTGLVSIVVAICFFVAMFLSPIAQLIPSAATAAALIYVGVLMMNCVTKIDWLDPAAAFPAFVTIAMMPFTYNISNGIGLGLIVYVLVKLCTGKIKEINITTVVIGLLFTAIFFLTL